MRRSTYDLLIGRLRLAILRAPSWSIRSVWMLVLSLLILPSPIGQGYGVPAPPPPPTPSFAQVTAAPHGGAIVVNTPWAIYDPTTAHNVFAVIENNGDIAVHEWDPATQTLLHSTVLHAAYQVDNHAAPSIILMGDGHYLVGYSKHIASPIAWRRSTNAHDTTVWDTEATNNQGASTYVNLFEMSSEGAGTVYLFFRFSGTELWFLKSTNYGVSFGGATKVYSNSSNLVYWHLAGNGTNRVDIIATDLVPSSSSHSSLAHAYMSGGNYYKSDGTLIGSSAFTFSSMTKIIDGPTVGGGCFPFNINMTGPTVAVNVYLSGGTDNAYYDVKYAAGTWTVTFITNSGGTFYGQQAGGVAVDTADHDRYVCALLVAGQWQVFAYARSGGSFVQGAQLTSTTGGAVTVWLTGIVGGGTYRFAGLNGTYTTDTNWNTGVFVTG